MTNKTHSIAKINRTERLQNTPTVFIMMQTHTWTGTWTQMKTWMGSIYWGLQ